MTTIIPIKQKLDSISPSFCAAKWNFSTIWLNDGSTASCYHCTKHQSDVEEVIIIVGGKISPGLYIVKGSSKNELYNKKIIVK